MSQSAHKLSFGVGQPGTGYVWGAYADPSRQRKGIYSRTVQGPANSRADQVLRRFEA